MSDVCGGYTKVAGYQCESDSLLTCEINQTFVCFKHSAHFRLTAAQCVAFQPEQEKP